MNKFFKDIEDRKEKGQKLYEKYGSECFSCKMPSYKSGFMLTKTDQFVCSYCLIKDPSLMDK